MNYDNFSDMQLANFIKRVLIKHKDCKIDSVKQRYEKTIADLAFELFNRYGDDMWAEGEDITDNIVGGRTPLTPLPPLKPMGISLEGFKTLKKLIDEANKIHPPKEN